MRGGRWEAAGMGLETSPTHCWPRPGTLPIARPLSVFLPLSLGAPEILPWTISDGMEAGF